VYLEIPEESSAYRFESPILLCPHLHRTAGFQGLNVFVFNGRTQFQGNICNECQEDGGIQERNFKVLHFKYYYYYYFDQIKSKEIGRT
jgi:hypothetical protein